MTRPDRRTFLAPLLAVLAILLGISGSASGAFNHAATEVHYGDFLLWEAKALEVPAIEIADPTRGNGVWVYDTASGVPIYVRQNPWTFFDPLGLKIEEEGRVDEKPVDHPGRENDFRDNRNYDNLESAEKKAVRDEYDGLVMTAHSRQVKNKGYLR